MRLQLTTILTSVLAISCADTENLSTFGDDIVDVDHTQVKDQSIGNCWSYATISWAESLELTQGNEVNLSESWITYWHWYEQLVGSANPERQIAYLSGGELGTGGWWGIAGEILLRYGVMTEAGFIPQEANSQESRRQATALAAIEQSLEDGLLSDPANRRDRRLVRQELDRAWNLDPEVIALLDGVFGDDVSYNLYAGDRTLPEDSGLRYAKDIVVGSDADDPTIAVSLADAIGTAGSSFTSRRGRYAWNRDWMPSGNYYRREQQKDVQRALHQELPVMMAWYVDFNAMDSDGAFRAKPSTPGRQGGHMVVLEDYEIDNVPGYGTLEAGTLVTDQAALDAALDDDAEIKFFRVKNSWGTSLAPPQGISEYGGYHDLYSDYLYARLCKNDSCSSSSWGLWAFVLPPAAFSGTPPELEEPTCELAHDICEEGNTLDPTCGGCVEQICGVDPYCCETAWDYICVDQVATVCELGCDD